MIGDNDEAYSAVDQFSEVVFRCCNCNEDGNGQKNWSTEKTHLMAHNSDTRMNIGDGARNCSGCFVLRTADIFEMDFRGKNQATRNELSCRAMRSSRRRCRVRG